MPLWAMAGGIKDFPLGTDHAPISRPSGITKDRMTSAIAKHDAKSLDENYLIQEFTDHAEKRDGEFLIKSLSTCTGLRVIGGREGQKA